jgi:ADP-heptose:LPS heptosyltransferase
VLIYQIGSLGDTLVSIPVYRVARRHFGPDAELVLLCNRPPDNRARADEILLECGLINRSIGYVQREGSGKLATFASLWPQIAAARFDAVIYAAPAKRDAASVQRDLRFFQSCGIRRCYGFHAYPAERFAVKVSGETVNSLPHEAVMRLNRLQRDGIEIRPGDSNPPWIRLPEPATGKVAQWLSEGRRHPGRPLVALCPGANQEANLWPEERFIELGRRILDTGSAEIVIAGGPREQESARRMTDSWGEGVDATGRFSVLESAALLSLCAFQIGLDTGTTHMASAVGTPCVSLYGQRNLPGQWWPLGAENILLMHAVPCMGCGLSVCTQPGHPCLSLITVDEAWAAVQSMLHRFAAASQA